MVGPLRKSPFNSTASLATIREWESASFSSTSASGKFNRIRISRSPTAVNSVMFDNNGEFA